MAYFCKLDKFAFADVEPPENAPRHLNNIFPDHVFDPLYLLEAVREQNVLHDLLKVRWLERTFRVAQDDEDLVNFFYRSTEGYEFLKGSDNIFAW